MDEKIDQVAPETKPPYILYTYVLFLTPEGKGYGCFAIKKLAFNKYQVAGSFCSPYDRKRFSKPKARLIATNRLLSGNSVEITTDSELELTTHGIIAKIKQDMLLSIPGWAKMAFELDAHCSLKHDCICYEALVDEFDLYKEFYYALRNKIEAYNERW